MHTDHSKQQESNTGEFFSKAKHYFQAKVSSNIGKVFLIICCCVFLFSIGLYFGLRASLPGTSDVLGMDKPSGIGQDSSGALSTSEQDLPGHSFQDDSELEDGGQEGDSYQEASVSLDQTGADDLPGTDETPQGTKPGEDSEQEAALVLTAGGIIMPVSGEIIRCPGWFYSEELGDWRYYPGIDIATAVGTEVKAVVSGIIKRIYKDEAFGEMIVIGHGDRYETRYARVSWSGLALGQKVAQGEIIGRTTGEVLHFQLLEDNEAMDPSEFLNTGN